MSKKSVIARGKKRLKTMLRLAKKRAECKRAISKADDYDERIEALDALQKLHRNASPTRWRRRCRVCGRPRGVYRKFGLCRIHLRESLMNGDVPGGRKASW